MSTPVLSYENPRHRRPWWRSYDAAVVLDLVLLPAVVFSIYWAWPDSYNYPESGHQSHVNMVQSLRSQIDLFKLHHNGRLPGACPLVDTGDTFNADTFWNQMTRFTDEHGNTSPTKTATHVYGPNLQSIPTNPLNNSRSIALAPAPGVGYVYDYAGGAGTGKVWGVDAAGAQIPQ